MTDPLSVASVALAGVALALTGWQHWTSREDRRDRRAAREARQAAEAAAEAKALCAALRPEVVAGTRRPRILEIHNDGDHGATITVAQVEAQHDRTTFTTPPLTAPIEVGAHGVAPLELHLMAGAGPAELSLRWIDGRAEPQEKAWEIVLPDNPPYRPQPPRHVR